MKKEIPSNRRRWLFYLPLPLVEGFLGLAVLMWGLNLAIKARRDGEEKKMETALQTTVLSQVGFKETPLPDAIRQLNAMIHRADPSLGDAVILWGDGSSVRSHADKAKITLTMRNAPAAEALRYTSALATMRYRHFGRRVLIVPLHHSRGHVPPGSDWHSDLRNPVEIPFDWIAWRYRYFRDVEFGQHTRRILGWFVRGPSDDCGPIGP